MPTHSNSNSQGTAGAYAGGTDSITKTSHNIAELVTQMKKNFLEQDIEIMDGLTFNQYDTLRTIHYYLNSRFEGGDTDENGNDKFFHNIINHRNAHSTKNIDLDTKDVRVETDLENKYWASWILRMELQNWMRDEHFSSNLNQLSDDLPKFGSVVWKKVVEKNKSGEDEVCIKNVDLRDLVLDQTVERICDSKIVAERIIMTSQEIQDKVEDGGWDPAAVKELTSKSNMPTRKDTFMRDRDVANVGTYSLTDAIPTIDVYEVWGWIPEDYLPESIVGSNPDPTKSRYVMAIVGGLESGVSSKKLFCEEADPEDFPYEDVHMRKVPGRWLGLGNTELLIPLQIRMNELVNRFFMALRLGAMHFFQTRGKLIQKNLLQDGQDGDIIESTHPVEPIATEIRSFVQYQNEAAMIEALADKICNTPEVVTGESMPAATPFRLGAQLGGSAAKIFDYIRENCGIFVGKVMYDWVLKSIASNLTQEHVLNLMGSSEELAAFMAAHRRSILLDETKKYILSTWYVPSKNEYSIAERALSEQMDNGDHKITVKQGYFTDDFIEECRIVCDPTGESEDKVAQKETMGNLIQILASNPGVLQDPNMRMMIGYILESAGISPLKLAGFISAPTDPQAAMGAAPPAAKKFSNNPGDAGSSASAGLTPESVNASLATQNK